MDLGEVLRGRGDARVYGGFRGSFKRKRERKRRERQGRDSRRSPAGSSDCLSSQRGRYHRGFILADDDFDP